MAPLQPPRTSTRRAAALAIGIAAAALVAPHGAGAATGRLYLVDRDAGIPPPEKGTASAFTIAENGSLAELSGSPFPLGLRFPDSVAITSDGTRAVAADAFDSTSSDPAVQGFAISPAGAVVAAQSQFTPLGGPPRVSAVSPDGRFAYVTSDSGGIEAFSIAANGALTQIGSGAVGAVRTDVLDLTPDGRYLLACPGTTDQIQRYSIGVDGSLALLGSTPSGTGAIDGCAISPDGRFFYTTSTTSDTIATLAVGSDGGLTPVGLPVPTGTTSAGPPALSPDGRFLYMPTQGTSTVMTYRITDIGVPSLVGPGPTFTDARDTAVSPDGRYIFITNKDAPGVIKSYARNGDGTIGAEVGSAMPVGGEGEMLVMFPSQPPTASATARAAAPGSSSALDGGGSTDEDGAVVRYDWDFGDGTTLDNGGPSPLHVYSKAGIYTARLTVTDDQNCSTRLVWAGFMAFCNGGPSATTTVTLDTPPLITRVSLSRRRFAVASGRRKVTRGTTFRYTVSEPATVRFGIAGRVIGRRVRGRCRRATRRNAQRPKCIRYVSVGAFSQSAVGGANRRRFSGRIRRRKLKPGGYRAELVATDSAGSGSAARRLAFRVVRP